MKVKLKDITDTKPNREHGKTELESLKCSIKENDLIEPLVINQNNKMICGRRRYQALVELGIEEAECNRITTKDEADELLKAIHENVKRKQLSVLEEGRAWKEYKAVYEKLHPETKEHVAGGKARHKPADATVASAEPTFTQKASKETGKSQRAIQHAVQVADAVNEYPQLEKFKTGRRILRKYMQLKDEERIKQEELKLEAEGKFKTIVIDPPWEYEANFFGRTHPEYATMSIEELEKLPLNNWIDNNCHVYLWTTNGFLPEAFKLLENWGLEYRTCITWCKPTIGMGSYFRNNTEHILFAVKGKLTTRVKDIGTWFEAKRGKHSEKPEVSYKLIEKASYPPYLEVFGRKERKNWKVIGNIQREKVVNE